MSFESISKDSAGFTTSIGSYTLATPNEVCQSALTVFIVVFLSACDRARQSKFALFDVEETPRT